MNRPEQDIHKAVVSHLNVRAERDVFFWHTPNGGKRGMIEAKIFKSLGVRAGIPDLIFLNRGKMYALELKAIKGRLSSSQAQCISAMRWCGAEVAVAHSLDEALVTLECWGILKRDCSSRVPEASQVMQNERDRSQSTS